MSFVLANNVNTTLAAAASSSSTTLTLASATNLPTLTSGQIMPLTLNDAATGLVYEVVYVTAITGATLTVTRAQEGTGAQNWSIGDYAFGAITAGVLNDAAFPNSPTMPTPTTGDNSTNGATTAFVQAALTALKGEVAVGGSSNSATGTTVSTSASFTPATNGDVLVNATLGVTAGSGSLTLSATGATAIAGGTNYTAGIAAGSQVFHCTSGTAVTLTAAGSNSTSATLNVNMTYLFVPSA